MVSNYAPLDDDCSIRACQSFAKIFHKCITYIAINLFYIFSVMLVLCLMLSVTHYFQNYAGIIGESAI